ncbi:MAG: hypothetical protein AAGD09_03620 [Cyanobacteria bacterium P01_F01_bin.56]
MATDASTYAQAAMNGRVTDLNSGGGNAEIRLYDSGSTLLLTYDLGTISAATDACPSVASPASLPIDATAAATGTVDNAELRNGSGTVRRNYTSSDIGTTSSGNPIEISSLSVTSGQAVRLTACVFRQPC